MRDELAQRIAARLHETLDRRVAADVYVGHAERGLADGGPEEPVIAITVEEVARIAARVARESLAPGATAPGDQTPGSAPPANPAPANPAPGSAAPGTGSSGATASGSAPAGPVPGAPATGT